jgi:two-component system NarL family response regulator
MSSKQIRVLVADDHPMIRAGLAATINVEPDMNVIASAADGSDAANLYREHRPDVALIDLKMPVMDGVESIQSILEFDPDAKIVVLSTYQGDEDIFRSLKAGAKTYLLKDMLADELVRAIRDVARGGRPIPPAVSQKLAERVLHTPLTPRELDVLRLIAKGLRNKEIAAALSIADQTAQGHVKSILEKFNVHDRTEAIAVAARRGIIHLDS